MGKYLSTTVAEANGLRPQTKILVVTATAVETAALHKVLRRLPYQPTLLRLPHGNQTYYIGALGKYAIVHVQCEMGAVGLGSSLATANEAIAFWKPKAVVMVGIAFGIDRKSQHVGDVLLSKTVIPYDLQRRNEGWQVDRSARPPAGATLFNRFKNYADWKHKLPTGKRAAVIGCDVLSGESLIDDAQFRDALVAQFPTARGGEMEGVGIYSAAQGQNLQWILVKAICDFADGKKSVGKKRKQAIAAAAAASLCRHVFSIPEVFKALKCKHLSTIRRVPVTVVDPNADIDPLFDVYQPKFERAYLSRAADADLQALLRLGGLWITGPSGCGKTCSLLRNLHKLKQNFVFVDLSRCIGMTVPEVFQTVVGDLADRLSVSISLRNGANLATSISDSVAVLCTVKTPTFVILDEVPLDEKNFDEFVDAAVALTITLSNTTPCPASRLIFASIDTPIMRVRQFNQKIEEKLTLFVQPVWPDPDLHRLLLLISKILRLQLSEVERKQVVLGSRSSPRLLKTILRTLNGFRDDPKWTLARVIEQATSFNR